MEEIATIPAMEETPRESELIVVFPQSTTELVGGQSFRMTVFLKDYDGQPVAGAQVTAELWTPGGELFTTLPCSDKGGGRYLAEPISLPLREAQGSWQVIALATWGEGMSAQGEGQFNSLISYSERLEDLFGFWIDLTDLFPYKPEFRIRQGSQLE